MARVLGPSFVALQVRDLESSARFYEERLGLERVPGISPEAVVFATGPLPFAVRKPLVDLEAVEKLVWGVALWMRCDDPRALYESLGEAGVSIVREPFDGPFGYTFAFVDPDGYTVRRTGPPANARAPPGTRRREGLRVGRDTWRRRVEGDQRRTASVPDVGGVALEGGAGRRDRRDTQQIKAPGCRLVSRSENPQKKCPPVR